MAEGAAAGAPTFKLVLVGDGGTGKVSNPRRLFRNNAHLYGLC